MDYLLFSYVAIDVLPQILFNEGPVVSVGNAVSRQASTWPLWGQAQLLRGTSDLSLTLSRHSQHPIMDPVPLDQCESSYVSSV